MLRMVPFPAPQGRMSVKAHRLYLSAFMGSRTVGTRWRSAGLFDASATTGSSRAAERAGMKPNTTPISVDEAKAATMVSTRIAWS